MDKFSVVVATILIVSDFFATHVEGKDIIFIVRLAFVESNAAALNNLFMHANLQSSAFLRNSPHNLIICMFV